MRNRKKIITCILLFFMMLSSTITVSAEEAEGWHIDEQYHSLYDALAYAETHKDEIGFSRMDFGELCIGKPIQTYSYVDDGFEELREMYPLIYQGGLVLWAINVDGKYQITTGLTTEINEVVDVNSEFALIYDMNNCYLYMNGEFVLLCNFNEEVSTRAVLNPNEISNIELRMGALSEMTELNYDSTKMARDVIYFSCNVGYISQNPYKNLCWAATIASITNYCKGTSLSMADIAADKFGYVKDDSIDTAEANNILGRYDVEYRYNNKPPTQSVILSNIKANYPIYGCFVQSGTRSGHAVVIYGINVIGDYLSLMDPANGFTSATHNGSQYIFVSANTGVTYELYNANCYSW